MRTSESSRARQMPDCPADALPRRVATAVVSVPAVRARPMPAGFYALSALWQGFRLPSGHPDRHQRGFCALPERGLLGWCPRARSTVDSASASGAGPPERCGHPRGTPSEMRRVLRSMPAPSRDESYASVVLGVQRSLRSVRGPGLHRSARAASIPTRSPLTAYEALALTQRYSSPGIP
jgi:hypothetical protein